MWSAASVLVCALDLLGRSAGSFPPIALVDVRPADVSVRAEAFVRTGDDTIYLLTTARAMQVARRAEYKCGELNAIRKLASVLVHEEWHVLHGGDERGAYEAQLMALVLMNVRPGHPVHAGVLRAMKETLSAAERRPTDGTGGPTAGAAAPVRSWRPSRRPRLRADSSSP